MGGDGGSVTQRSEMVKTKKKVGKEVDPASEAMNVYTRCSMTGELLHVPIMACELGRLYNKLAVVQHIMNARSKNEGDNLATAFEFSHIKNLKDVVECKVKQEKKDQTDSPVYFNCPVTNIPANGKRRFVIMRGCGCVLSERGLQEVVSGTCLGCGRALSKAVVLPKDKDAELKVADAKDLIAKESKELEEVKSDKISAETLAQLLARYAECVPLNPSANETDLLRALMKERRRLAKAEKKQKKEGVAAMDVDTAEVKSGTGAGAGAGSGSGSGHGQKRPREDGSALPDERNEKRARLEDGKDKMRSKTVDKAKAAGKQEEFKVAKPAKIKEQRTLIAEAAEEAQKAKLSSGAYARLFMSKERQNERPNLCSSKPLSANPTFL